MAENRLSSISKADSDEKIGEFWDGHDFTEFDTGAPDADFEVISTVPVQLELLNEIEKQAAKRGVNVETIYQGYVYIAASSSNQTNIITTLQPLLILRAINLKPSGQTFVSLSRTISRASISMNRAARPIAWLF